MRCAASSTLALALALAPLACTQPVDRAGEAKSGEAKSGEVKSGEAKSGEPESGEPGPELPELQRRKPDTGPTPNTEVPASERAKPPVVREDLVAKDLPPVPGLELRSLELAASGDFSYPEGSDEISPRAAVRLSGGLLLAGQVYVGRVPGSPSKSWRWLGVAPSEGPAQSSKGELGAIRAAASDGEGGALLVGTRGTGFDMRGWFGSVDAQGQAGLSVDLDSPNQTELFVVAPGGAADELALVGGYVDAQGWLVSLDAQGGQRWQTFLGSYGYTQIHDLARVGRELLVVGNRAQAFAEPWSATLPASGGDPSGGDAKQHKLEVAGADPHLMLELLVDLGDAGLVAVGVGKKNYIQDHDQLLALGLDPSGEARWSKTYDQLRVTELLDARPAGGGVQVLVGVPGSETSSPAGLALVSIDAQGQLDVHEIADSRGELGVGFVAGEAPAVVVYKPTKAGIAWRELSLGE